jgi:hypothetical protein
MGRAVRAVVVDTCSLLTAQAGALETGSHSKEVMQMSLPNIYSRVQRSYAAQVSLAGIRAAMQYWPDAFKGDEQSIIEQLKPHMRATRPVMVSGFEAMVMARLLHEGTSSDAIVADWPVLLASSLADFGTSLAARGGKSEVAFVARVQPNVLLSMVQA